VLLGGVASPRSLSAGAGRHGRSLSPASRGRSLSPGSRAESRGDVRLLQLWALLAAPSDLRAGALVQRAGRAGGYELEEQLSLLRARLTPSELRRLQPGEVLRAEGAAEEARHALVQVPVALVRAQREQLASQARALEAQLARAGDDARGALRAEARCAALVELGVVYELAGLYAEAVECFQARPALPRPAPARRPRPAPAHKAVRACLQARPAVTAKVAQTVAARVAERRAAAVVLAAGLRGGAGRRRRRTLPRGMRCGRCRAGSGCASAALRWRSRRPRPTPGRAPPTPRAAAAGGGAEPAGRRGQTQLVARRGPRAREWALAAIEGRERRPAGAEDAPGAGAAAPEEVGAGPAAPSRPKSFSFAALSIPPSPRFVLPPPPEADAAGPRGARAEQACGPAPAGGAAELVQLLLTLRPSTEAGLPHEAAGGAAGGERGSWRYERRESVGVGAFGEVWRARGLGADGRAASFVLKRVFVERGESVRLSGLREVHFGLRLAGVPHTCRFVEAFEAPRPTDTGTGARGEEQERRDLWLVFLDEGLSLRRFLYEPRVDGAPPPRPLRPSHLVRPVRPRRPARAASPCRARADRAGAGRADGDDAGVAVLGGAAALAARRPDAARADAPAARGRRRLPPRARDPPRPQGSRPHHHLPFPNTRPARVRVSAACVPSRGGRGVRAAADDRAA